MTETVNRFYNSIKGQPDLNQSALIELFLYFLTVDLGQEVATAQQVAECFVACDLVRPANISARLREGAQRKNPKYLRVGSGYRLHRLMREDLSKKLGAEQVTAQTSATLRTLEHKFPEGDAKEFLKETIDCFEAGANRATITMSWILVIDHLFNFIIQNKINEFNIALASDKSIKLNKISSKDDFSEIRESKFIELCRSSKIITNDVRKILDEKRGIRNTCAHPSGIAVSRNKTIEFVEDLITNVVLKY